MPYGIQIKTYLHNQDIEKLREVMPITIDCLQERESEIRPFLKAQGYEDLFWWK